MDLGDGTESTERPGSPSDGMEGDGPGWGGCPVGMGCLAGSSLGLGAILGKHKGTVLPHISHPASPPHPPPASWHSELIPSQSPRPEAGVMATSAQGHHTTAHPQLIPDL